MTTPTTLNPSQLETVAAAFVRDAYSYHEVWEFPDGSRLEVGYSIAEVIDTADRTVIISDMIEFDLPNPDYASRLRIAAKKHIDRQTASN